MSTQDPHSPKKNDPERAPTGLPEGAVLPRIDGSPVNVFRQATTNIIIPLDALENTLTELMADGVSNRFLTEMALLNAFQAYQKDVPFPDNCLNFLREFLVPDSTSTRLSPLQLEENVVTYCLPLMAAAQDAKQPTKFSRLLKILFKLSQIEPACATAVMFALNNGYYTELMSDGEAPERIYSGSVLDYLVETRFDVFVQNIDTLIKIERIATEAFQEQLLQKKTQNDVSFQPFHERFRALRGIGTHISYIGESCRLSSPLLRTFISGQRQGLDMLTRFTPTHCRDFYKLVNAAAEDQENLLASHFLNYRCGEHSSAFRQFILSEEKNARAAHIENPFSLNKQLRLINAASAEKDEAFCTELIKELVQQAHPNHSEEYLCLLAKYPFNPDVSTEIFKQVFDHFNITKYIYSANYGYKSLITHASESAYFTFFMRALPEELFSSAHMDMWYESIRGIQAPNNLNLLYLIEIFWEKSRGNKALMVRIFSQIYWTAAFDSYPLPP